jgi:hypothetical protein
MRVPHHHAKATMAQELRDRPERGAFHDEHDAKVCRRSCQVKSLISAISSAV